MDSLSQLTGQVMANSKAADYYCSIPANVDIGALADKYAQLSSHSDANSEAFCLAAEAHIRQTAVTHFHRPEVLVALATMEKSKDQARKRKAAAHRRDNAARRRAKKESKQ